MRKDSISALPHVRVLGRHVADQEPLTLFYTASGIECVFTGSELWLQLSADYNLYEPWLSVELNGAWISRFPVSKGNSEVCLLRGMTPGVPKHIRVLKDVQAMNDDPAHLLQITGLRYADGTFLPLSTPRYRLEFVGDSITSGEGAIGAEKEEDWISAFFSAENNYARLTADTLNADFRIVSQSGWGIVCGWDNDARHCIFPYYEQVCGLATGARNATLGAHQINDFSAWPADAVIVNLGTNDCSAMGNPPWCDSHTGAFFKLDPNEEGHRKIQQSVVDALALLRRCNPNAVLVWAYGMLGSELADTLRAGVTQYCTETGDTRAFYLNLPNNTLKTMGARQHPGLACHQRAATVLSSFLKESLK